MLSYGFIDEDKLTQISEEIIAENMQKMQIANTVFWIVLLLRIIFLVAVFIIVVKVAIWILRGCRKPIKGYKRPKKSQRIYLYDYYDQQEQRHQITNQSPTGWTFNEQTKLWEPPAELKKESKSRWKWDEEKRIWIEQKHR